MKPNESVEGFFDRFLHLYCEFPEEDTYWDFLKQKFEHLVHISLHGESETPNVCASPSLVNHDTLIISKD